MRKVLFILGQLSDTDAEWLARNGDLLRLDPETELIREGAAVDSIFLIVDGLVDVTMSRLGKITELGPGEIVGELSLVDSRPASASVTARLTTAVVRIAKSRVLDKIADDHEFGLHFYKAISIFLADRMRSTIERMGYGTSQGERQLAEGTAMEGEIDAEVLDNLHLAGARFERIFKSRLVGEPERY